MTRVSVTVDAPVERFAQGLITVDTKGQGCTDVTAAANAFLASVDAREGSLIAQCLHTTASLTVQENADADVQQDLITALGRLAPAHEVYRHNLEGEDDMPGHIKAALTGHAAPLLVAEGQLWLGTWQALYLMEHRHGRHERRVALQFTGR